MSLIGDVTMDGLQLLATLFVFAAGLVVLAVAGASLSAVLKRVETHVLRWRG